MEVRYKKIVEGIKLTRDEAQTIESLLRILREMQRNTINEEVKDGFSIYALTDIAIDAVEKLYYDDRIVVREE